MGEFKTAQDIMKNPCARSSSGFNARIHGASYSEVFQHPHERTDADLMGGWELASELIEKGRIYFVHNFHQSHGGCPNGYAFTYGDTWACNTCNNDHLDKGWWKIKVFKDGDSWLCVGLGFENLQESDFYAFGDTREEAISHYGDLFVEN